jgi:hypothetical protein
MRLSAGRATLTDVFNERCGIDDMSPGVCVLLISDGPPSTAASSVANLVGVFVGIRPLVAVHRAVRVDTVRPAWRD